MISTCHRMSRSVSSTLALSLMAAVAQPASAQRSGALEEVIVTAQHRQSSIQDTPISISVLSSQDIQDIGISNAGDIGVIASNVTVASALAGKTGVSFFIRGIGESESLATFDPAVGLYIDDVLISKSTGSLLDVLDIERIEVLRGPQGTLYGRNTMGGAINVVTRKPIDDLEGSLKATLGNYDQRDLRGMLNVPILSRDSGVGLLAARISAATLNRDGTEDNDYHTNVVSELGTQDRTILTAQLLWEPTDRLDVTYSYDRTRIDEIPGATWPTTANPARPGGPLVAPYLERRSKRPDSVQIDFAPLAKTDVDGHSLRINYELTDALTLKSISAYREMDNIGRGDTDGTPIPLLATADDQSYDFKSQELRLVGSALDSRLDFSLGLFYMEETGEVTFSTLVFGAGNRTRSKFDNKNWALYGHATYALTDRFDITGGLRYTEEEREMSKLILPTAGVPTAFPNGDGSFENVSPMVSLGYTWNDNVMTYAKVSTGFQSGGFSVREPSPIDFVRGYDEEHLLAYEVGVKSTLFDRIRLNAALWYSDYDDKKINIFNPETLGSTVRNAGVVEIYGLEIEMLARLNDFWDLGVNYGYTKPEFTKYDAPNPSNPSQMVDMSGSANFPFSPEHDASVYLTYEYPLAFGVLRARLDWAYKDNIKFLVTQPERNSQPAYDLWNARLTLDEIAGPSDTTLRISAWVKNLTDEGYWNYGINIHDTLGLDVNSYGEPRTYGLDLEVSF